MHLPNRGFHQENLAFSPSCIPHNMDYRQKMVVASNQTRVVDDDDDDDLEALRRAALQTLRAKDNIPKKTQPIPQRQTINYQLSQPRIFYKGISPVKRDFYQPKPQCQNGNLHFQTHCLNPNLITIVPVEESISEPLVLPPPSQPPSQPSDVSDVSVKSELSDDSKFCRYKDDASGSEEDDEERRSANVSKVKAEVKNKKEDTELVEEASEPEVESTQASPQRSEDDEDEEEEEEDDDDVLIMADLEEEDSLERLMDEMEREMNVDKPSDKKEKRHGKKDSKLSRKADTGVGQKEKTKKGDEKKANVGSTTTISASSICTNLKTEQRASSPYNPNKPVHRRRSLSPKIRSRRKSPRRSPRRSPLRSSKKCQRDGAREAVRYRSPRKSPTRFSPRPRSPRLSPRLRSPRGSPRRSPNRSPRRSPLRSPPRMRSPRLSPRLRSPRPQRSPRVSPHPRSPRLPRSRSPRLSPRPRSPRMRSRSPRLSPRRSPTRMSPRTRSPKLSPRPRSPRLSPRRPSPRLRSPRISPRRLSPRSRSPRLSPRRISPRARSPRISPRRLSPRARSPRMSPRRMSPRLRSPRLSPHRSPWSSPRNSPRLSPRRRRSPKELSRKIRPRSITPERASSPPLKKRSSPNSKLRASPDVLKCKAVPKKDEAYEISDSGKDQDNTNADPVLEARRRKFESTKPIDPINANKKIKLSKKEYHTNKKTEDQEPAVVNFPKLDEPIEDYQEEETESYIEADVEFDDLEEVEEESPAATIASTVNVCSEIEPAKLEREKPLKKKKKKDKELYNVHKIKSELPLSERIGKEKKCKQRKDIPSDGPSEKSEVVFDDLTVEDEEGDLRTELSRRRAERLNRAAPTHQQSVRLVQSAFKGVVSEVVKNSARTVRKQLVKGEEKLSQKEVRRVTVLHRPVTDLHESEDETPLDSKVPIRFRLGLNKVMQDTRDSKASRKSSKRQNRKVKHKTNLSSTDVKNPR